METFDVIVLGAGSAGVSAALRASDQGAQVCIIEQEKIGGSCIHKGLYPLKLGLGLLRNNESNFNVNGLIDSEKLFFNVKHHKTPNEATPTNRINPNDASMA